MATSVSRPQRLRTYRDGLIRLVRCTCWLRLLPGNDAGARLLADCREEGYVLVVRRDRLGEKAWSRLCLIQVLQNGASIHRATAVKPHQGSRLET